MSSAAAFPPATAALPASPISLSPTEELLHTLKYAGKTAMVLHNIKAEQTNPNTNGRSGIKSRICMALNQATNRILISTSDITDDEWRSIIANTLLQDNKEIVTDEKLISWLAANNEQVDENSSQSQSSSEEIVESILDSRERNGGLEFHVRWEDTTMGWEPYQNFNCNEKLLEFYQAHPGAARCYIRTTEKRGPMQEIKKPAKSKDDTTENGHIIYAHSFVNTGGNTEEIYTPPTGRHFGRLVDMMVYYASNPTTAEEIAAHRAYTSKVDNQDGFANPLDWSPEDNEDGNRKHFAKGKDDHSPVPNRLTILTESLLPILVKKFQSIPVADLDKPLTTNPLIEVGFTSRAYGRRKEHASHSGTTFGLALLEEIAAIEFPGVYQWRYVVLAECRHNTDRWFLECFFSTLCQAYFALGGFNSTTAAFATQMMDENEDKSSTKFISATESHELLAAMDFVKVRANIAEDRAKLDRLKHIHDIHQTKPEIARLEAEVEKLTTQLTELQLAVKEKMKTDLEGLIASTDQVLRERAEVERLEELLEVGERYLAYRESMGTGPQ